MPYKSEAQKKWMEANRPDLAKEFKKETPKNAQLPQRLGKPSDSEKRRLARLLAKNKSRTQLSKGLTDGLRNQQIKHNKRGNRIGNKSLV